MAQLLALKLPPGSGRRATPQDTRSAWFDMSLVRWDAGQLVPVGGWKRLPGIQLPGEPRSLLSWRDNANLRWVAAATLGQVQVWDGNLGHVVSPGDFLAGEPVGIADGYGVGDYGAEPYGVHRSHESEQYRSVPADAVSLDNWGEDLVAMGSVDGRLLMWSPTLPVTTALAPVAGAPRGRACIVTEERHIVVIGADGDPRRVSWCSQEVPTDWTPSVTNTAGSLQLRSTGVGLAARRVADGALIFCDDDVHRLSYVGTPYVYGLVRIGAGCGPAGPEAMVAMSGRAVWWGHHGFWLYDGSVRPLDCPLTEYLESDLNPVLRGSIYGYHNGIYAEITWGYCSHTSVTPDSYVTWNYETNQWWHGRQLRSIGCEPGAFGLPLLGAPDGKIYQHETGWLDDGNPRGASVFCETGDIQIGDGDAGVFVSSLIPDAQHAELLQWHLRGSWAPGDVLEDYGTYVAERADGIIDTCFETRALRVRLEGLLDGPWALGRVRLALDAGAGR